MGESDTSTIDVGGSLSTGGGDVAGRDVINIVLNTIEQQMPKSNVSREFKNTLITLEILIETLKAWKEVHNALDEIRSKFDQFKLPIASATYRRQMLPHKSVKLYWRPVLGKVEHFENRIHEVVEIEKKFSKSKIYDKQLVYTDRENDVVECRKKGFLLIDLSKNVESVIVSTSPMSQQKYLIESMKMKIGFDNFWWMNLSNLADELDNNITEAMYISDKLLRESAEMLYKFSQRQLAIKGK